MTNSPLDALSATVSVNVMSQLSIRESTISSAGIASDTASRTRSMVISSSVAGSTSLARTNATSASTRGWTSRRIEMPEDDAACSETSISSSR